MKTSDNNMNTLVHGILVSSEEQSDGLYKARSTRLNVSCVFLLLSVSAHETPCCCCRDGALAELELRMAREEPSIVSWTFRGKSQRTLYKPANRSTISFTFHIRSSLLLYSLSPHPPFLSFFLHPSS